MGGDDSEDNTAFVLGPKEPRQVFALADRFFGPSTYAVVIEQESASAMQREPETRGWQQEEAEPVLVMAQRSWASQRYQRIAGKGSLVARLQVCNCAWQKPFR